MTSFKITSITFDFTTDYPEFAISLDEQQELTNNTVGQVYVCEDESDLCDVISDNTDWLVEDVTYEIV